MENSDNYQNEAVESAKIFIENLNHYMLSSVNNKSVCWYSSLFMNIEKSTILFTTK